MARVSRKMIDELLNIINNSYDDRRYELIINQNLGNRRDYWYTYGIKRMVPKYTDLSVVDGELKVVERDYQTGWKFDKVVADYMALKDVKSLLWNMMTLNDYSDL